MNRCTRFAVNVGALSGPVLLMIACSSDHVGALSPPTSDSATGEGGAGGASGAGPTGGEGGSTGVNGAGGDNSGGRAGSGGAAGAAGGGAAGAMEDAGVHDGESPNGDAGTSQAKCVFHDDAPFQPGTRQDDAGSEDAPGGGGFRDGGDGGPPPSITVEVSPFIGSYLADSGGRTLYTTGADLAGDCQYPPMSTCEKDCAIAWPPFDAGARTLATGLDDRVFGSILRADGTRQTTYYGWPLYYFKTDTVRGALGGQGKAKTWFAATVIPPGIVIMKAGTAKYLADGTGRTLYAFDQDAKGTASSDPVSACTGGCLDSYPALLRNRISAVSALEPTDFSVFLRSGGQQLAYRGAPLYYAAADRRSGDLTGVMPSWSLVAP